MQEATDKNCKRALYAWRKWTLKFHLLQSVSKWIFMFAKEQQGIFSFTRNDSSNSKYLALAGN